MSEKEVFYEDSDWIVNEAQHVPAIFVLNEETYVHATCKHDEVIVVRIQ